MDAALKHLFATEDGVDCNSELDQVLGCAYDEEFIRSALHLAGTRITKWTTDKNAEYDDESKRCQIIARLKKRWAVKLLSHLVEALDGELDLASKQLSLETHGESGNYKIKLNVTPIFEIDDTDDDDVAEEGLASREHASEQGDAESEDYEEDDYVPPSVVSTARRPIASDHATQANAVSTDRQTAAQINATLNADNRSFAPLALQSPPGTPPESTRLGQLRRVRLPRFRTFDPSEGLLMLQLPTEGSTLLDKVTLVEKISRSILYALQGKVAEQNFIGCELHHRMNCG
jgi:hypothetical protein